MFDNPPSPHRLTRRFYRQDAVTVARSLLGKRLVRLINGHRVSGWIVETEAYLGVHDRAAHSFGGRRTARTETMYADGGHAYVFMNYGIHHLLNVVTEKTDVPSAVLIRALEPCDGLDLMFERRPVARRPAELCSGPGKLCAALGVNRSHDALDLVQSSDLYIESCGAKGPPHQDVVVCPRIGVDYAGDWAHRPLRFYLQDSPHVSRK